MQYFCHHAGRLPAPTPGLWGRGARSDTRLRQSLGGHRPVQCGRKLLGSRGWNAQIHRASCVPASDLGEPRTSPAIVQGHLRRRDKQPLLLRTHCKSSRRTFSEPRGSALFGPPAWQAAGEPAYRISVDAKQSGPAWSRFYEKMVAADHAKHGSLRPPGAAISRCAPQGPRACRFRVRAISRHSGWRHRRVYRGRRQARVQLGASRQSV